MNDHSEKTKHSYRGFSLIELLAVVAILVILVALSVPVFQKFSERSKIAGCLANSRQIGLLLLRYAGDHNSQLPPWNEGQKEPTPKGQKFNGDAKDNANPAWSQILVDEGLAADTDPAWKCPADRNKANTAISYTLNANVARWRLVAIPRQSETILLTERYDGITPRVVNRVTYAGSSDSRGVQNLHGDKAVFVFVDGHAEVLKHSKDPQKLLPPDSFWLIKE